MKKILITLTCGVMVLSLKAQDTTRKKDTKNADVVVIDAPANNDPSKIIFTEVEQSPEFPGGIEAFYKFLGANIHYPKDARDQKKHGRVIVQFVVETDGSLSNVKLGHGVFPSIDAEALRVIKSSPKWKPAIEAGHPVRVQYSVPIVFSLSK